MTVEQAVVERLLGDATVAALVSTRVYQLRLPQSPTLPAVRVQLIDHPLLYHLRGGEQVSNCRIQVDAYAENASGTDPYDAAADVADAITAAMSGQQWSATGTPPIDVVACFRIDRRPAWEAAEIGAVRILQDWNVWARHG